MLRKEIYYSLNDVTIIPDVISDIKSRKTVNIFRDDNMLPLFASPMSAVVNLENYEIFNKHRINAIIPRNISFEDRIKCSREGKWVAWSLNEFNDIFVNKKYPDAIGENPKALIDVANGHMKQIYDIAENAKVMLNGNIAIMVGNIANPKTYEYIAYRNLKAFKSWKYNVVDFVRVGIGTGNVCITSNQTSVHMPMATLLDEINKYRKSTFSYDAANNHSYVDAYPYGPKVIADGGMRGYSDIIKALALGADYVMCGTLFASLAESAADFNGYTNQSNIKPFELQFDDDPRIYTTEEYNMLQRKIADNILTRIIKPGFTDKYVLACNLNDKVVKYDSELLEFIIRYHCKCVPFSRGDYQLYKTIIGMSTKEAQAMINKNAKLKTSEGTKKNIRVEYTIERWLDNFKSYLASAMSYTNSHNLEEFIGNTDLIVNSSAAQNCVAK